APVLAVDAARARQLPGDLDALAHGHVATAGLPVVGLAAHGLRVTGAAARTRARAVTAAAGDEIATAAIGDPDATAVVAPGGALDAVRLRQLAFQLHAATRVDRAVARATVIGFAADPVAIPVRWMAVARVAVVARVTVAVRISTVVIARIAVSR